ncbi:sialate O-acetylesterase [soil metagenome]
MLVIRKKMGKVVDDMSCLFGRVKRLRSLVIPGLLCGVLLGLLGMSGCRQHGKVSVPPIFSDHMVLQKAGAVPVWGKAGPGTEVTVSVAGQMAHAKADAQGKWRVVLDLSKSGPGPYEMTIQGPNRHVIKDVVIGEVWVATGESNMDFQLSSDEDAKEEIAQSNRPMLRQFTVHQVPSPGAPLEEAEGKWRLSNPQNTPKFSAIGYYFGKKLQQDLDRPVGVLNLSRSGAFCETWMSREGLEGDPDLKEGSRKDKEYYETYSKRYAAYAREYEAWEKKYGREDKPAGKPQDFADPSVKTDDWKTVKLPGQLRDAGLPDAGVAWLRKDVEVAPGVSGRTLRVDLGSMSSFTTVYWNGVKVGETRYDSERVAERGRYTYEIPSNLVKAGKSVLAVRLFSPEGNAGLSASPGGAGFRVVDDRSSHFLAGKWLAKSEYALPPLSGLAYQRLPPEPADPPFFRNLGSALFNGVVHPFLSYAIRGVISYQNDNNNHYSGSYERTFALLIKDWRKQWNQSELPYYFCQMPNAGLKTSTPADSERAELREAQARALALPQTGQAVLIDLGEEMNNHPRNKKEVGDRLARIALAETYGKQVIFSGPVYRSMKIEGDKVRLTFAHTEGGLVAQVLPESYRPRSVELATRALVRNSPGSELEGFSICGPDHKWVWAQARIDGETVVVWSPEVAQPVAVRYAWADNPTCNLYNSPGLPASPFRTDDFPAPERKLSKFQELEE